MKYFNFQKFCSGKRVAISAMIDENGFDYASIDVFECDADHSMNSLHFIGWMEHAAFNLRKKFGPDRRICIVIDNAPWHNQLTDETKPPQRSWRKHKVEDWLREHRIDFDDNLKKSELLQLAFSNLPSKEFKVDVVAKQFDVEILRLPVKHCSLNPVEYAW
jgi:hypothetical protein